MAAAVQHEAASGEAPLGAASSGSTPELLHVRAALAAGLLVAAMLTIGALVSTWLVRRYIGEWATLAYGRKGQLVALGRETFRRADVLAVYASSELLVPSEYRGDQFFGSRPTGFQVMPFAEYGIPPLNLVHQVAAAGDALRGRKVVISLSPSMFAQRTGPSSTNEHYYLLNFSRLQAGEALYGAALESSLRRRLALRMLAEPAALTADPLLALGSSSLAQATPASHLAYAVLRPIGRLQNALLGLQDQSLSAALTVWNWRPEWERRAAEDPSSLRKGIDWAALRQRADEETKRLTHSNALGLSDRLWAKVGESFSATRGSQRDDEFRDRVARSPLWGDLELLLDELQQLGAQPLVLSMPFHGAVSDYQGVSPEARRVYYARLEELARLHGVPLRDFAEHDTDRGFVWEPSGHLSPKGWIAYDQALDRFYHGALR